MEMAAKAQVREQALEHVLETLCSSLDDVQSCLRLASTNKALNVLVGEGSFWRRFFAEAVQVVVLACECAGVAMADVEARPLHPRAVSERLRNRPVLLAPARGRSSPVHWATPSFLLCLGRLMLMRVGWIPP